MLSEFEKLFLALSDKTRLRLLFLMADGEVAVGYLAEKLGESQPKISRHLAYLRSSGLVTTRREGKWIYYGIASQTTAAASLLNTTFSFLAGKEAPAVKRPRPAEQAGDAYRPPDRDADISAEIDMTDWKPSEIDVFLL